MARKRKTLKVWMDECISDNSRDMQISMFVLVHMQGTRPVEIYAYKKLNGNPPPDTKDIAELFEDKAATHCQSMQGRQTFNVWAFYGDSKDNKAWYIFTIDPTGDEPNDGYLTTEAPTAQGALQQQMRHYEAREMQVYQRQAQLDAYTLRLIEQQGQQIQTLMAERFENGNMVMTLIGQQHDRAHDHRMKELSEERTTKMIEQGVKLLPAVANTVFNKEVFPQSTEDNSIIETMIDGLIQSSTDADDLNMKINGMFAMFNIPTVMQGILMARVNKGLQKRAEEAEAKAKAREVGITKVTPQQAESDMTGGVDVVDINSRRKKGGNNE